MTTEITITEFNCLAFFLNIEMPYSFRDTRICTDNRTMRATGNISFTSWPFIITFINFFNLHFCILCANVEMRG